MNRRNVTIIGTLVAVVVIGIGIWLYNAVQGDTKPASGPVTAVPLALDTPASTSAPAPSTANTAEAASARSPVPAAAASNDLVRFQIVQAESKASFTLDELLSGKPTTVIGTTDQVAGEIALKPADLSSAQVGVITVNARTLATDSDRRDRAIKNFILNTDSYEFITFSPTAISGLSGSGVAGTPYSFQISGDLTIRDKTLPVVFDVTVTAEGSDRLSGSATATVSRADYGLDIPSVPMVANVSEQVKIEISFVAMAS